MRLKSAPHSDIAIGLRNRTPLSSRSFYQCCPAKARLAPSGCPNFVPCNPVPCARNLRRWGEGESSEPPHNGGKVTVG